MSENQGWIKLHRKLLDNPISRKPNYLAVWCYLLARANHQDNYFILDGKKTLIKEGEFVGSLLEISNHFKISISNVSRIIKYFETETMVETRRTKKYTYFSILNWNLYQEAEIRTENKEKTNGKQRETNNNVKNDKEKEKDNKDTLLIDFLKSVGLPEEKYNKIETWIPDDFLALYEEKVDNDKVAIEWEKFCNWFTSANAKRKKYADWKATWRNWITK